MHCVSRLHLGELRLQVGASVPRISHILTITGFLDLHDARHGQAARETMAEPISGGGGFRQSC